MKLHEMENTAVCLETQKEYDEYMKMCEEAGWKWSDGKNPTEFNAFHKYDEVCVTTQKNLTYCDREFYEEDGYVILSFNELLETMKIKDRSKKGNEKKLHKMSNVFVYLKTQEEYDEYMKICEEAGWKWSDGKKPTKTNVFHKYDEVCVNVQKELMYCNKGFYEEDEGYSILSFNELLETMKIKD